jgi:serine/threonine protein kinase
MDLVEGGTLKDLIETRKKQKKPFTEEEISLIMHGLFNAVQYMHDMHVIHRDIKPGIYQSIQKKFFI